MKKTLFVISAILVCLLFTSVYAYSFENTGIWELDHLYTQKISVGVVSDLYPSTGEWSAGILIKGIQFLNNKMAFLRCETPSGAQAIDYKTFYTITVSSKKSQIIFTLEEGDEITVSIFEPGDGQIVFSYCDAGPGADKTIGLYESTNKIVFRNHFGTLHAIE